MLLDVIRLGREDGLNLVRQFTVGHARATRAVCIDIKTDRFCNTNGIRQLHQHLVAYVCSHQVFGDVARGISC